jgi:3-oxoacyl-[acyl-carrier protein] reductase
MTTDKQHRVIVTGAGRGIGFGIAEQFARQGANVALSDIDAKLAQDAANQINETVGAERVLAYTVDVSDVAAIRQMTHAFTEQGGPPTVIVANAGVTYYKELLNCTPEDVDKLMGINLRGTFFTAQIGAQAMIDHNVQGSIILLSSVVGMRAFRNFSIYSMTKAGIAMLAKSLAMELGEHGIRANAISPGAILTERTQAEDPNYAENWASVNMTGRVGRVEDIANMAVFLSSPEAKHITGQNMVIDGGWTTYGNVPDEHPAKPVNQD